MTTLSIRQSTSLAPEVNSGDASQCCSTQRDHGPMRCPKRQLSYESIFDCDDDDDATQVTSNTHPDHNKCERYERNTVSTCPLTAASAKQDEKKEGKNEMVDLKEKLGAIVISDDSSSSEDSPLFGSAVPLLTPERIRSFITDYYEDWDSIFHRKECDKQVQRACFEAFFDQYYTAEVIWIRSSGNPLGRKDMAGMLTENVTMEHAKLVSIDHISVLADGKAATVVYTADLQFSFQNKPQNDRTVLTSVVKMEGVEPKIDHVHWSVGQPIPTTSRWQC